MVVRDDHAANCAQRGRLLARYRQSVILATLAKYLTAVRRKDDEVLQSLPTDGGLDLVDLQAAADRAHFVREGVGRMAATAAPGRADGLPPLGLNSRVGVARPPPTRQLRACRVAALPATARAPCAMRPVGLVLSAGASLRIARVPVLPRVSLPSADSAAPRVRNRFPTRARRTAPDALGESLVLEEGMNYVGEPSHRTIAPRRSRPKFPPARS